MIICLMDVLEFQISDNSKKYSEQMKLVLILAKNEREKTTKKSNQMLSYISHTWAVINQSNATWKNLKKKLNNQTI